VRVRCQVVDYEQPQASAANIRFPGGIVTIAINNSQYGPSLPGYRNELLGIVRGRKLIVA
jgi:hypothetical protein